MSDITNNPASTDILTILQGSGVDALAGLTLGVDAFIGFEPAEPAQCLMIFDTYGYPPDKHYNPAQRYERPAVQIRVRAAEYLTGFNLINAATQALHNGVFTVGATVYTAIFCSQPPALLDWDANGRCRWVATFDIQCRPGEAPAGNRNDQDDYGAPVVPEE